MTDARDLSESEHREHLSIRLQRPNYGLLSGIKSKQYNNLLEVSRRRWRKPRTPSRSRTEQKAGRKDQSVTISQFLRNSRAFFSVQSRCALLTNVTRLKRLVRVRTNPNYELLSGKQYNNLLGVSGPETTVHYEALGDAGSDFQSKRSSDDRVIAYQLVAAAKTPDRRPGPGGTRRGAGRGTLEFVCKNNFRPGSMWSAFRVQIPSPSQDQLPRPVLQNSTRLPNPNSESQAVSLAGSLAAAARM